MSKKKKKKKKKTTKMNGRGQIYLAAVMNGLAGAESVKRDHATTEK